MTNKKPIKPQIAYSVLFKGEKGKLSDFLYDTKDKAKQFLNECDGEIIKVLITPF